MNRLIESRKKQLNQLKHILKLEDLLTEYDRQNAFLNYQVKELLQQNQMLQRESIKSNILNSSNYDYKSQITSSHKKKYSTANRQQNIFTTQKKQLNAKKQIQTKRYNYHFDEPQTSSLLKDKIAYKEILKTQTKVQPQRSHVQFKVVKEQPEYINLQNSKSRSKSRSGSKKKLEVTTNSKVVIKETQTQNKNKKLQSPKFQSRLIQEPIHKQEKTPNKNLPQTQQKTVNRSPYLQQKEDIFLHSFGEVRSKATFTEPRAMNTEPSNFQLHKVKIQEKFPKHNETQVSNMLKSSVSRVEAFRQENLDKESQQLNKFQTTQKSSVFRSSQKRKNHSLNPSPKIQLTTSKKFIAVQPFTVEASAIKQYRYLQKINTINSSELQLPKTKQKKRRFLTMTSSSKDKCKN